MEKLRGFLTDVRIAVLVAALAIAGYVMGWYDAVALNTLLALAGFQGLAGVRALIDSSGQKTYILAAIGAVLVAALFLNQELQIISVENLETVMKELVGLTFAASAATLHHAKKKAEN